jgi:predicted nucleic acid-binding Zn ribbon protein
MNLKCQVHDEHDDRIFPYRCSRCGGCYQCEHKFNENGTVRCKDGVVRPVIQDPGVPVEAKPFSF